MGQTMHWSLYSELNASAIFCQLSPEILIRRARTSKSNSNLTCNRCGTEKTEQDFRATVSFFPTKSMALALSTSLSTPKGRPGMSDNSPLSGISGLSFDSTLLSPLSFFCLIQLLFPPYLFSARWPMLQNFFTKILQYFSLRYRLSS